MIITDKKLILHELHKALSNDYPGVFHIKYTDENYQGSKCTLTYAIKAILDPTNNTEVDLWKEDVTRVVNDGVTLHYIVDISLHPEDETDSEGIADFALTRYNLGGGFLICNHSKEIPVGKMEIVIIFGKLRKNDEGEYLPEEQGLDKRREFEMGEPIDFDEIMKELKNE